MRPGSRSASARLGLTLCSGLIASCVDHTNPPPGAEPGDLMFWASSPERSGALVVGGSSGAEPVPTDAVWWVLPASQLVRADGGAITVEWLEQVELVRRGEPEGCGRCTGTVIGAPLLVFAGDLCPIPEFARQPDPRSRARAAELSRELAIAWPGDCGCTPDSTSFDPEPPPLLHRISPSAGPIGQILTAGSAGHVAGLSNLGVWLRRPNGELVLREPAPRCGESDESWRFEGPLRAAAVSERGEIVLAERSSQRGETGETKLHSMDGELSTRQTFSFGWDVVAMTFTQVLGPDRIAIAGFEVTPQGNRPRFQACTLRRVGTGSPPELDCEEVPVPEALWPAASVRALAEYDGHILLLLETSVSTGAEKEFALAAAAPGDPWVVSWLRGPRVGLPSSLGIRSELVTTRTLLVHDRKLSICAGAYHYPEPLVRRERGFVMEAILPARLEGPSVNLDWTVHREVPHECSALLPGPGGHARVIRVGEDEEPRLEHAVDPATPPPPSIEALPLALDYDPTSDRSFIQARDGSLYVWKDTRTSTETYEKVMGGALEANEVFCPLEMEGELVALGSAGRIIEIGAATRGTIEVRPAGAVRGVSTCAYEAKAGRIFAAGREGSRFFARWIDPETLSPREISIPALPEDTRLFKAADSGWGSVFVLGSEDIVLEVRGDEARRLAVDWDDPNTPATESQPELSCCTFPSSDGTSRIVFDGIERPVGWLTDLDAHGGAVWLSGRGRAFFRAFPGRIERATYDDAYLDPAALRADCGDRAFVAQLGLGPLVERGEHGRLTRADGEYFRQAPVPAPPHFSDFSSGSPTAMFGPLDRLYTIFGRSSVGWGSVQTQGALERRLVPGPLLRGAANARGDVLVAGAGGQLYLGLACP